MYKNNDLRKPFTVIPFIKLEAADQGHFVSDKAVVKISVSIIVFPCFNGSFLFPSQIVRNDFHKADIVPSFYTL